MMIQKSPIVIQKGGRYRTPQAQDATQQGVNKKALKSQKRLNL
jgi:hypothetical protein